MESRGELRGLSVCLCLFVRWGEVGFQRTAAVCQAHFFFSITVIEQSRRKRRKRDTRSHQSCPFCFFLFAIYGTFIPPSFSSIEQQPTAKKKKTKDTHTAINHLLLFLCVFIFCSNNNLKISSRTMGQPK